MILFTNSYNNKGPLFDTFIKDENTAFREILHSHVIRPLVIWLLRNNHKVQNSFVNYKTLWHRILRQFDSSDMTRWLCNWHSQNNGVITDFPVGCRTPRSVQVNTFKQRVLEEKSATYYVWIFEGACNVSIYRSIINILMVISYQCVM